MQLCPFCGGVGVAVAGSTSVKDEKHGKIKTAPGTGQATHGCTACGGTGVERAFTPW